ncbi:bifunctional molybdopterin-guanine dinucleotide biosynthesis adaptor protein MobB/molybdopterin molybdotransferase MoeA [Sulfitobacter sp. S0837]|uniref:bifunctional molybdopterin-guanine dinucleotide biosynthesis adaptor protein MobB/molybdopterin molybdotransferase MoeA n=1 Tax=Sulfitobacter maritimus TaxID=2741719 RepID=UPI0015831466|nr:bifunctional molybdopterin-guanine dinucleotide biosynthesis adaptor protein MobB/molybdopterin molybdotransferase MoeA [Sulfitobacter maritimus]NUH65741.1 bifunctional molybdopterin-guanine dinucleotide biosynthesis adaptor protein MobB/molybdopterin molybdotransferase MoeA [Sulfitobacter maritimus]
MRVYGVVGWKNAGKTGLMERLVAEITGRGFTVSTVKHAHHSFDVDHPGKDSHRHRIAGAREVLLASGARFALMHELRGAEEPPLEAQLARLSPVDLVLVEGYKRDAHPKVEAHRAETGNPLIAPGDNTVRAVAADVPLTLDRPVFDLNDTTAVADFILREVGLITTPAKPETPLAPPPLRNDCFALPPGVHWTPVQEALEMLRGRLHAVTEQETQPVAQAGGRVLAKDVTAIRANPPLPNTAVDGYGFAGGRGEGVHELPLVQGRAAAGDRPGAVPKGQAIRVLTGAALPQGVDTVILQEDVTTQGGVLRFNGPIKQGANTRKAGEDVQAGDVILAAGTRIGPAELALLAAAGVAEVRLRKRLKVGVISTGDELVEMGGPADDAQIYDANRPMLLHLAASFGHEPVDLGRVADDRSALRARLDAAAEQVDVILTSGGASAGEEDHVSALLTEAGAMALWRIAVKPGRPLALGLWQGVPVFGLPGNPVAALVCTLIFGRPAMGLLAGAGWQEPQGFDVPAAFEKRKKPGRREYLRARMREGRIEVFASEGSGRISGLSWAEGLVELNEAARDIQPGDLVRFIPYGSFTG